MKDADRIENKPIVLPCAAGVLCIASLFIIGKAGAVFPEMYRDFGVDPLPVNIRIISLFNWFWTLPLGCLVATVLVWGSRKWTRKRSLFVSGLAMVITVILFWLFGFVALTPIFDMKT